MRALRRSSRAMLLMLPVIAGIVALGSLLGTLVKPEQLSSLIGALGKLEPLAAAIAGSISSGNPATSYLLAGEFLMAGFSLFAVTAFIVSWVTVGVVQMPAEITALGLRFALCRNAVSFVLSLVVAATTVSILIWLG